MVDFLDRTAAQDLASQITILNASIETGPPSVLCEQFLEIWHRVRENRIAPAWEDFDPVAFHKLWRHMVLWNVEGDVYDFRVIMAGVNCVQFFGNDPTGKSIRDEDFTPPDLFEQFYLFHKLSALWLGPVWFTGTMWYWNDRGHIPITCMTLPLSRDGKHTNKTVNVWDFNDKVHLDGVLQS